MSKNELRMRRKIRPKLLVIQTALVQSPQKPCCKGFTETNMQFRCSTAYLLADVEIIATFKLANINGQKLETLLHKFFDHTRLDVQLQDRFGIPVNPREWFLVPLEAIEEVIEKVKAGTIEQFRYDPEIASLTRL